MRTVPARSRDVEVRVSVSEKRAWRAAAKKRGRTLSDWLRDVANRAAADAYDPIGESMGVMSEDMDEDEARR
jgi:uncharacterized protein (DUF1778 family)